MKKIFVAAVAAFSLTFVAGAVAALDPGTYSLNPADAGCVKATYAKKTLRLEKNCATTVVVAAYAEVTGVAGQTFQSAEFTLASASQCQGGSPRFRIITNTGSFPVGCNNVAPIQNPDGTVTYRFTAETINAMNQGLAVPTGTISQVFIILDVQGVADLTKISFNGIAQKVVTSTGKGIAASCKNGGYKTFTSPRFKNQGQCVKFMVQSRNAAKKAARG